MDDYELLFEEKLDIFAKLVHEPSLTWQGETRTALKTRSSIPGRAETAHHLGRRGGK